MTQKEALDILKTGASVFLTGEPGAGKTFVTNKYVDHLRDHKVPVAITASTGIAATHIGGMTIHSWSGLGIKKFLSSADLDKIASSEHIYKRINKTNVLIIDEVSMLSANMLDMVDAICREVKRNAQPFGGMQVILVGDFFQLPPVEKIAEAPKQGTLMAEKKAIFAFESAAWARLAPLVCYLSEQHRQEDADFLSLLSAIRRGEVQPAHRAHMEKRKVKAGEFPAHTTKLFSHNANVDEVNAAELAKLASEMKEYNMTSEGGDTVVANLKKGCLSPEILRLKIGAAVMCTKNNQKEHFANGTLATVQGFDPDSGLPVIKTSAGRVITIEPAEWKVEENGKVRAKITQLPLRLAWAITVHKSQGMSLDAAVMDLSSVFEYGQGYVALSRVRKLLGLYLLGINEHALKVHPQILKKDTDFRKNSADARSTFANLSPKELFKMHKNFTEAFGA